MSEPSEALQFEAFTHPHWDAIVMHIAPHLPASDVLSSRLVCRHWQACFDAAGVELVLLFPFLTEAVRRAGSIRLSVTRVVIITGQRRSSCEPEYLTVWARCLRSLDQLARVTAARVAMPWRRKLFGCLAAGLPNIGTLSLRCSGALVNYGHDSQSDFWRASASSIDVGGTSGTSRPASGNNHALVGLDIPPSTNSGGRLPAHPVPVSGNRSQHVTPGSSPPHGGHERTTSGSRTLLTASPTVQLPFLTAPRLPGNGLAGLAGLAALRSLDVDVIAATDVAELGSLTKLTSLCIRLRELDSSDDDDSDDDDGGGDGDLRLDGDSIHLDDEDEEDEEEEDQSVLRLPADALATLCQLTALKTLCIWDERDQGCRLSPPVSLLQPLTALHTLTHLELHMSTAGALGRPPSRCSSSAAASMHGTEGSSRQVGRYAPMSPRPHSPPPGERVPSGTLAGPSGTSGAGNSSGNLGMHSGTLAGHGGSLVGQGGGTRQTACSVTFAASADLDSMSDSGSSSSSASEDAAATAEAATAMACEDDGASAAAGAPTAVAAAAPGRTPFGQLAAAATWVSSLGADSSHAKLPEQGPGPSSTTTTAWNADLPPLPPPLHPATASRSHSSGTTPDRPYSFFARFPALRSARLTLSVASTDAAVAEVQDIAVALGQAPVLAEVRLNLERVGQLGRLSHSGTVAASRTATRQYSGDQDHHMSGGMGGPPSTPEKASGPFGAPHLTEIAASLHGPNGRGGSSYAARAGGTGGAGGSSFCASHEDVAVASAAPTADPVVRRRRRRVEVAMRRAQRRSSSGQSVGRHDGEVQEWLQQAM